MRLIRFQVGGGAPQVGVADVRPAVITTHPAAPSLASLLALPFGQIQEICAQPDAAAVPEDRAELLAPVDGRTEVWVAGVTYERSRTARMAESENSADNYDRMYDAERPELFFKSAA